MKATEVPEEIDEESRPIASAWISWERNGTTISFVVPYTKVYDDYWPPYDSPCKAESYLGLQYRKE
ncbi:MAG: hypothetical protein ACOC4Z_01865 [Patescibacteria group bacterium]